MALFGTPFFDHKVHPKKFRWVPFAFFPRK